MQPGSDLFESRLSAGKLAGQAAANRVGGPFALGQLLKHGDDLSFENRSKIWIRFQERQVKKTA
jgi:hypothetical protein